MDKIRKRPATSGSTASWPASSPSPATGQTRMATTAALLYHKFEHYFWCGFYRLADGDLLVGPYQGPLACQVLARGRGVCWEAVRRGETLIVPDVRLFPGHIACDARSLSEIVVPLRDASGAIIGRAGRGQRQDRPVR